MADRALTPAKHLWLGRLLPYQLPNIVRAHQKGDFAFKNIQDRPVLFGRILELYSPVRRVNKYTRLACIKAIASAHSEPGSNSIINPNLCKLNEELCVMYDI